MTGSKPARTLEIHITQRNGKPLESAYVTLYHQTLRKQLKLADGTTDGNGELTISYGFRERKGAEPNLFVEIRLHKSDKSAFAVSNVRYRASEAETFNLVVRPIRSDYQRLKQVVEAHTGGTIECSRLTKEDITYIAQSENLKSGDVQYLVKAHQLGHAFTITRSKANSEEAFFGLLKQGLAADIQALLSKPPEAIETTLKNAADAGIIATDVYSDLADPKKSIAEIREQLDIDRYKKGRKNTVEGLLSIAKITKLQKSFIREKLGARQSSEKEFWSKVKESGVLTEATFDKLVLSFELAKITRNDTQLVNALVEWMSADKGRTVQDLAKWDAGSWKQLLKDKKIDPPETIGGEHATASITKYAQELESWVEKTFPTAFVAHKISPNDFKSAAEVKNFLLDHPDYTFDAPLQKRLELLDGIRDPGTRDRIKSDLCTFERLYAVTPDREKYRYIKALIGKDFRSAASIVRSGKSAFFRELAEDIKDEDTVGLIFQKAVVAVAVASILYYRDPVNNGRFAGAIQAGRDSAEGEEAFPELTETQSALLATLFGSQDYCLCDWCASVHSPAAYLLDVMLFLQNRGASTSPTPLQVILGRRPDLRSIELSCENTTTPLPYLDLVNEVLEGYIAGPPYPSSTGRKSEDLKSHQEYINKEAYEELAKNGSTVPYDLTLEPFDLWMVETNVYLRHLGVPRPQLMEIFGETSNSIDSDGIALEYLGLTAGFKYRITSTNTQDLFASTPVFVLDLLKKLQTTYTVIREYRHLRYSRVNGTFTLDPDPGEACTLEEVEVIDLTAVNARRLVKFLRLAEKLGWSLRTLDHAFRILNKNEPDAEFLRHIGAIQKLGKELNLQVLELLTFWGLLEIYDHPVKEELLEIHKAPSLYESVFLSATILETNKTLAPDAFSLREDGELEGRAEALKNHLQRIQGTLEVRADDLLKLIEFQWGSTDPLLTLSNLSVLYRNVKLLKSLGLNVNDYISLREMTGLDPFDVNKLDSFDQALEFPHRTNQLKKLKLTIPEIVYLLGHPTRSNIIVALQDKDYKRLFQHLREALDKVKGELALRPQGEGGAADIKLLLDHLAKYIADKEVYEKIIALVDLESDDQKTRSDALLVFGTTDPNGFIDDLSDANSTHQLFDDPVEAKQVLTGGSQTNERSERIAYVWDALIPKIERSLQEEAIREAISDALSLSLNVTDYLLRKSVDSPTNAGTKPIEEFRKLSDVDVTQYLNGDLSNAPIADLTDQKMALMLLEKISKIVLTFNLTSEDIEWLMNSAPNELHLIRFDDLPVENDSALPVEQFESLTFLMEMRKKYRGIEGVEKELFDLIELANSLKSQALPATDAGTLNFFEELNELTGWEIVQSEHVFLFDQEGLNVSTIGGFLDLNNWRKLDRFFDAVKRLGASAERVWGWIVTKDWLSEEAAGVGSGEKTIKMAQEVKELASSKYDNARWPDIARPLRDDIREKQRDALLAFVINNENDKFPDKAAVYDHFLLDVEMSTCQLTSRIKQAGLTLQLFVQRCLMNLEPDVTLTKDDAKEWLWMKNYRVWEANRKVFLYPENWLEPEFRHDMSPFFKELEQELNQNEVTDDVAKGAFRNYLKKVHEVGRMDIVAVDHEIDGCDKTLHVIGRTKGTPNIYFYRKRTNEGYWTPWEKVGVDIEGEQVLLASHNGELYLTWLVIKESSYDGALRWYDENEPTWRYLEIRLAWSKYKNGKWDGKKITTGYWWTLGKMRYAGDIYMRSLKFPTDNSLQIECRYSSKPFEWLMKKEFTMESGLQGHAYLPLPPDNLFKVNPAGLAPNATTLTLSSEDEGVEVESEAPPLDTYLIPYEYKTGASYVETINLDLYCVFKLTPFDEFIYAGNRADDSGENPDLPQEARYNGLRWSDHGDMNIWSAPGLMYANPTTSHYNAVESVNLLHNAPEPFEIVFPHNYTHFFAQDNFFFVDRNASYMITPTLKEEPFTSLMGGENGVTSTEVKRMKFDCFYHPYTQEFAYRLQRDGLEGLFNLETQSLSGGTFQVTVNRNRTRTYTPTFDDGAFWSGLDGEYPREDVDFEFGGPYEIYNWELFFHVPFLIAERLRQNRKFEDAQKWYHLVFDPTKAITGESAARYWNTKPLNEDLREENIQTLLGLLDGTNASLPENLGRQVGLWRKNPFNPHIVARSRLVAYQKAIVMRYAENLIEWGDELFRQGTLESLNLALLQYDLAKRILGRRPEILPHKKSETKTVGDLLGSIAADGGDSGLSGLEVAMSSLTVDVAEICEHGDEPPLPWFASYFCTPSNAKLLSYWDVVDDRLFKLRNCLDIEGFERQLPLFQPPIDPGLIAKLLAAGVSLSDAVNAVTAGAVPRPVYRFATMIQKAMDLTNELKSLGNALLAALEKRDVEKIALLRTQHELSLLKSAKDIRSAEIGEAEAALAGLTQYEAVIQHRVNYYASRPFMNAQEKTQEEMALASMILQLLAQGAQTVAGATAAIPDAYTGAAGAMGSPLAFAAVGGGSKVSSAAQYTGQAFSAIGTYTNWAAQQAAVQAGYYRRKDDWDFQAELAKKELAQAEQQILAARVRLEIAKYELRDHEKRIEQSQEVEEVLKEKFTNHQLYNWMVSQTSGIYSNMYKLAFEQAKKAEKAFQHELGASASENTFINFEYRDSLKKGLLAGERLSYDLRRMESAFFEQNRREQERQIDISLSMLNADDFVRFIQTSEVSFVIPEEVFDANDPGMYMRRLKSVRLTIPCIRGPYTSINCTLTLLNSAMRTDAVIREDPSNPGMKVYRPIGPVPRVTDQPGVRYLYGAVESITTNKAINDAGLFELNFRDERFLPFEGAGAVSQWRLELPKEANHFDYGSITDVIIHLDYTAREGGKQFRDEVINFLRSQKVGQAKLFSASANFPNAWRAFMNPKNAQANQEIEFSFNENDFPLQFRDRTKIITQLEAALLVVGQSAQNSNIRLSLADDSLGTSRPLNNYIPYNNIPIATFNKDDIDNNGDPDPGPLPIEPKGQSLKLVLTQGNLASLGTEITHTVNGNVRLNPDFVKDLYILIKYDINQA